MEEEAELANSGDLKTGTCKQTRRGHFGMKLKLRAPWILGNHPTRFGSGRLIFKKNEQVEGQINIIPPKCKVRLHVCKNALK